MDFDKTWQEASTKCPFTKFGPILRQIWSPWSLIGWSPATFWSRYILIYYYITIRLCTTFYDLSALVGCWSSVFIRRIIYNFLICVSFWLHGCCGKKEGCALVNRFIHASAMAVITPTDRPKSVHNRCVVEVLVAFLCCHVAFWIFFVDVRGFCHRTESDLFLFLCNR